MGDYFFLLCIFNVKFVFSCIVCEFIKLYLFLKVLCDLEFDKLFLLWFEGSIDVNIVIGFWNIIEVVIVGVFGLCWGICWFFYVLIVEGCVLFCC